MIKIIIKIKLMMKLMNIGDVIISDMKSNNKQLMHLMHNCNNKGIKRFHLK